MVTTLGAVSTPAEVNVRSSARHGLLNGFGAKYVALRHLGDMGSQSQSQSLAVGISHTRFGAVFTSSASSAGRAGKGAGRHPHPY